MSSSQNSVPQPPKVASSEYKQANASAAPPPKSTVLPEIIMDQHLKSTLAATPPAPPTPPEVMSSTAPDQAESAVAPAAVPPSSPEAAPATLLRQQPIPPASEPMQYRAIGLVRGKYVATEEQFTKGNIMTDDGAAVDAVLLGRVMSLVKKHIDLEQSHLWVVYPRTRENVEGLHVQIVGVWEPEKLNRAEAPEDPEALNEEAAIETAPEPELGEPDDKYFSVRGEVVFQSPDDRKLLVKIRRSPQQGSDESKIFKVSVQGVLEGKVVGYFWDLQVERQDNNLVLREGTRIGIVPPQKRSASDSGRSGVRRSAPPRRGSFSPPRREGSGGSSQRPIRASDRSDGGDRPKPITSQPSPQFSKPIKRSKETKSENSSVQPES
ncbi:MAG: hypothetical protein HC781_06855 [Leptolyngbyaceae cyanobacterium CSU_1_4]|nr:hypothetical protein [Leptolyngbyaceae cyanobacterium CSU_1_4]